MDNCKLGKFEEELLKDTAAEDGTIFCEEFLEGYHCLGHLCEFLAGYADIDEIFGYRWWVFVSAGDYIVAWDVDNGWYAKDYLKFDKEPLPMVRRKIFMALFNRYYKERESVECSEKENSNAQSA